MERGQMEHFALFRGHYLGTRADPDDLGQARGDNKRANFSYE